MLEQGGSRLQESEEERRTAATSRELRGPLGEGRQARAALLPGLQGGPLCPQAMNTTVPWPRLQGRGPAHLLGCDFRPVSSTYSIFTSGL